MKLGTPVVMNPDERIYNCDFEYQDSGEKLNPKISDNIRDGKIISVDASLREKLEGEMKNVGLTDKIKSGADCVGYLVFAIAFLASSEFIRDAFGDDAFMKIIYVIWFSIGLVFAALFVRGLLTWKKLKTKNTEAAVSLSCGETTFREYIIIDKKYQIYSEHMDNYFIVLDEFTIRVSSAFYIAKQVGETVKGAIVNINGEDYFYIFEEYIPVA